MIFEIAVGVLIAFGIRHVVRATAVYLWQRYAYGGGDALFMRNPRLLGRWEEGTIVPAPIAILRRIMEPPR